MLTAMLARTATLLLLPLSGLQALWLRRRATRLPGAAGPRSGAIGSGHDLQLLAFGDSIIDGVGIECMRDALPGQFAAALARATGARVNWRAEGQSGHAIGDLIRRLDSPPEEEPALEGPADIVLISVGVNDVTGLSSAGRWRENLQLLLQLLHQRWPRALVLFAGLPPMGRFPLPPQPLKYTLGMRAAELDFIAAELLAGRRRCLHVPTRINPVEHGFCDDGFHPSADSCSLWAKALAARIAPQLAAEHEPGTASAQGRALA